jgi:rhamnose utilization protein RhaD (predicted bifunctional aldolase and dehydrogenase)
MIEGKTELERLVARSRLIGAAPELVVHGGGNTSTKTVEADHLGRERRVLRIKGSGTDLATIGPDGFPGLFLDELEPLRDRAAMTDEAMVGHLAHCMLDPGARPPSIETLLHGFLPAAHVDHVHSDAICALTNHPDGRQAVAEALGGDVAYVPYIRPGFELSRQVGELGDARAVVLEHHGLVTWGDTHEESYQLTLDLVADAKRYVDAHGRLRSPVPMTDLPAEEVEALLTTLRGALSRPGAPCVLYVDRSQRYLADRDDVAAVAAGRGTPDHILRIGARSVVLWRAGDVADAVSEFADGYRAYFARHADTLPDGLDMLSPLPRVALVPGLGCVAAGATPRAARMHAEIAHRSHLVTALALDAFGAVEWLTEEEIFAFDYWPMELRKLKLAPAAPPLTGRVVVVAGGDGSSVEAIGARLAADGANVAADVAAAVDGFGGLDAVVSLDGADAPLLERAETVWQSQGSSGTVVRVGPDARPEASAAHARTSAVVARDAEAAGDAVAFLLSDRGAGMSGSVLQVT